MQEAKEVDVFLREFKLKMQIWDVLFLSRNKNIQTLAELEITPAYRIKVLETLINKDYAQGPLRDEMLNGADMWVFGKMIKGKEVYIKITLGKPNTSVICISFHTAEYPMSYPLKRDL